MSNYDLYDSAFLGILQNEGEIAKFLDALFSFLYRKTDFYLLMKSPQDRMGFHPGIAQKLVLSAFKKYEALAAENEARRQKQLAGSDKKCDLAADRDVPQAVAREETVTSTVDRVTPDTDTQATSIPVSSKSPQKNASSEHRPAVAESCDPVDAGHQQSTNTMSMPASQPNLPATNQTTGEQDDDPELASLQKKFQSNPESYNGAIRDNYCWSQSITDVDIRVKVPNHVRRGADVKVDIAKKHLRVSFHNADGTMNDGVNGELTWEIHKDESLWSLVPGEHVHVNLEKVQERWWDAVFTDEPKISVRKIDPSRPMADLDDEAQAKIEELMYNERQKRLGLPQSHEQKVHEMLKQAWDAEGSPFKGTPFDPSVVNVAPS